jgi:site-specific recombinase XerD
VEDGGDLRTLQEMMGHTGYRTTEIYAHVSQHHLQEEANWVKFPIPMAGGKKRS